MGRNAKWLQSIPTPLMRCIFLSLMVFCAAGARRQAMNNGVETELARPSINLPQNRTYNWQGLYVTGATSNDDL